MDNQTPEKIKKSILFEKNLYEKIENLANENRRDFTKQVKFMIEEYLKMIERK